VLAEAGANVVMADVQKDAVEEAAHGLSGTNKRVMPVQIDVTLEQSVIDALAESERAFGKLAYRLPQCWRADERHPANRHASQRLGICDGRQRPGNHPWHPALCSSDPEKWGEGHAVDTASVADFQNRRGTNQGPYSMTKGPTRGSRETVSAIFATASEVRSAIIVRERRSIS
jgi:NAD(P)-dependent dehydrogenase (short-subunit alcohol dehydrogenase family)